MNRLRQLICLLILLLFSMANSSIGQEADSGLRFYFQDQEFTKRTSFILFEDYTLIDIKIESQLTMYKLNFPFVSLFGKDSPTGRHPILWIIIPLTCMLIIVLVVLILMLKRASKHALQIQEDIKEKLLIETERSKEVMAPIIIPEMLYIEKENDGIPIVESMIGLKRRRINAIWLIGKFEVFDKKGMNITHLFSNKVKSLFIFIFLSTIFEDGISSDELSEVLCPGMDKTQSNNNRSVTMKHLRKIFEDMEGITLVHDKRNWEIRFEDSIYIDLVDLYHKRSDHKDNAMSIIGLYSLGNLLQNDRIPELDKFKGSFKNEALELLNSYGKEFFEKQQYSLCNEIANIIHNNFDGLNEEALRLKLKSLIKLRNSNKALQEYDNFSQRFKLLKNMKFTIPFNRIAEIE